MNREAALELAQNRGLDLIEISPLAQPPVARIMNYDKFRYEIEKKLKKQRVGYKASASKQIQITARAAHHDLGTKVRQTNKFLAEHHPVVIVLVLRGREKANKAWAFGKLQEFLKMIAPHKVVAPPKFGVRGINIQIITA